MFFVDLLYLKFYVSNYKYLCNAVALPQYIIVNDWKLLETLYWFFLTLSDKLRVCV